MQDVYDLCTRIYEPNAQCQFFIRYLNQAASYSKLCRATVLLFYIVQKLDKVAYCPQSVTYK